MELVVLKDAQSAPTVSGKLAFGRDFQRSAGSPVVAVYAAGVSSRQGTRAQKTSC